MLSKTKGTSRIYQLGFFSTLLCIIFVLIFAISLMVGLIIPTNMLSFTVCFLLAPCFVTMMVSIHYTIDGEKRIWSQLGISFAIIYAVMVSITYYIQLSVVRSNPLGLSNDFLQALSYSNVGSVMFAIDMLGYAFMALSTFVAAFAFSRNDLLEIWVHRLFLFHGFLFVPTIIFPLTIPPQTVDSSNTMTLFGTISLLFWCIIFVSLAVLVLAFFKRLKKTHMSPT